MLFNDHGPGQSDPRDGPWQSYSPPPRFTIHDTDAMVGTHAYQMLQAAKGLAHEANQLERLSRDIHTRAAYAKAGDELSELIDACRKSLALAVERLSPADELEASDRETAGAA